MHNRPSTNKMLQLLIYCLIFQCISRSKTCRLMERERSASFRYNYQTFPIRCKLPDYLLINLSIKTRRIRRRIHPRSHLASVVNLQCACDCRSECWWRYSEWWCTEEAAVVAQSATWLQYRRPVTGKTNCGRPRTGGIACRPSGQPWR